MENLAMAYIFFGKMLCFAKRLCLFHYKVKFETPANFMRQGVKSYSYLEEITFQ